MNLLSIILCIAIVVVAIVMFFVGAAYRKHVAEKEIGTAEEEARRIVNEAIKTAENKKREASVEAKEEAFRIRTDNERECKERRAEVQKQERRIQQKEEALDKKTESIEAKEEKLSQKLKALEDREEEIETVKKSQLEMLEKISGLSVEDAKNYLLAQVETDARHDAAVKLKEIRRCASDHASETTVSVVPLPNDEMKGRIIGREGRNIRALETATGVDLIIDDTPEAITISASTRCAARSPACAGKADRRRPHPPARIEEMVEKAKLARWSHHQAEGERAVLRPACTASTRDRQAARPHEVPHQLRPERAEPLHRGRHLAG
jgi:ribonuclease Y